MGVYLANGSQLDISIDNDYNGLVIRNGICKQINLKGEEENPSKKFYDEIGNGLQDLKSNRNRNKRERGFSFFSFVQKTGSVSFSFILILWRKEMRKIEDQHYKTKDHVPYVDIHYIQPLSAVWNPVYPIHMPPLQIIWKNLYKERREKMKCPF